MSYLCAECGEWTEELEFDYEIDAFVCPFCKSEEIYEKDRDEYLKEQALDRRLDESRGK